MLIILPSNDSLPQVKIKYYQSNVERYKIADIIPCLSIACYCKNEKEVTKLNELMIVEPLCFGETFTAESFYSKISDQHWSMWLDSCHSNHEDCQYDIIAWQPCATIETCGDTTKVDWIKGTKLETFSSDPLTVLEQVQKAIFNNVSLPHSNLPFLGGSLGYFSYDLGRQFESLPDIANKDINAPEMAIGVYQQTVIFDKKTNAVFLVCLQKNKNEIIEEIKGYITSTKLDNKNFKLTSTWKENTSQKDYFEKFDQIQQYLLSGDCYQINLAQRFSADYTGDEFAAYQTLRQTNNAPFSAFMRLKDHCILSVSPERFLKLRNTNVQSKPIKGTMPRHKDVGSDKANAAILAKSEKDRAENLMIVDLLRNDISKVCQPGTVKVPSLFAIESFPAVHHLVSTVEGVISPEHSATDLLRGAFPGGSITGAPKIRAMEIIEELEPHRRHVYCGSIGYISACGNMDTSITIRTLVCEESTIHCWAGGGIVADSTAESEYQETFDKVAKILPILNQN